MERNIRNKVEEISTNIYGSEFQVPMDRKKSWYSMEAISGLIILYQLAQITHFSLSW